MKLIDLRNHPSTPLLTAFVSLYDRTFTIPSEREDPGQWTERLFLNLEPPEPKTHILVAVRNDGDEESVVGGLVFEYYRESCCGLMTYLVVDPTQRRRGIARCLLENAVSTLQNDAAAEGNSLNAIFAEVHDPAKIASKDSSMCPVERLAAFKSFARRVEIDYVQPELIGGVSRERRMMLLSIQVPSHEITRLPVSVIFGFLHEFYRALRVANPDQDSDYIAMRSSCESEVALLPIESRHSDNKIRREIPVITLTEASFCLHYVMRPVETSHSGNYEDCPFFSSMELDLLAHQFQIHRLFGSACVIKHPIQAKLKFPTRVHYRSEGRHMTLVAESANCQVNLLVSKTTFNRSGTIVWHVTITPCIGWSFSEFDIIKLIHLYGGKSEHTQLKDQIRFILPNGNDFSAREILTELVSPLLDNVDPVAGTVELILRGRDQNYNSKDVIDALHDLHGDNDGSRISQLDEWIDNKSTEGQVLTALNGVVTGIFDFDKVGSSELLDTLVPTVPSAPGFLKVSRSTLVYITEEDRAFEQCYNTIGASPYLLIPHAVLLHNEALVAEASECASKVLKPRGVNLGSLSSARALADRNLHSLLVPNVFNYLTERTIRDDGSVVRGDEDRRMATVGMLRELTSLVDERWERRRETGNLVLSALLLVLTMLQVREPIVEYLGMFLPSGFEHAGFIILTSMALCLLIGITYGSRRK